MRKCTLVAVDNTKKICKLYCTINIILHTLVYGVTLQKQINFGDKGLRFGFFIVCWAKSSWSTLVATQPQSLWLFNEAVILLLLQHLG